LSAFGDRAREASAKEAAMKQYPEIAVERAMKVQEVFMRAMAKTITWWQAAEILGVTDRTLRRWRWQYEEHGYPGLIDRRWGHKSEKKVPVETVEKVLGLYRDHYFDFSVRHFHEKLISEHAIQLSYTWVKKALQAAGLIAKSRDRRVHRKRRPRRPVPGMLLHIDGSHHQWFSDDRWYDLLVILDDATNEVYYAQLVGDESTRTVMAALREVVERQGVFCALYSDRASHFFFTPKGQQSVDRHQLTQVGRAMKELGIHMIPAYSPQARGRGERNFRTWQGRLPQELRIRHITTLEKANLFLRETYLKQFNDNFKVLAAQAGTAFVPASSSVNLDRIFSIQHERSVNADNTVRLGNTILQIQPTSWRATLAGCRVLVVEQLDGTLAIHYGPHLLGRYRSDGEPILEIRPVRRRAARATTTYAATKSVVLSEAIRK
jgi:transposase